MLLKNCKIIYDNVECIKDILLENDKITKIDDFLENTITEESIIDVNYNWVLPGVIDVHTHMREPGLTHKEDFETGSKACAKGGITTFIDMPNTIPNTISEKLLDEKKIILEGKSYVDYGFHFGGSRFDNSEEIRKVKNRVASTKIFMNMSTGDMLIENEKILENLFKCSKIVSVHAEDKMVDKAIELSKKYETPLYLCHLSKKSEVEKLRAVKKQGYKIYGEVTPHHLYLNSSTSNPFQTMKPELKKIEDNIALWEAIKDGTIDTIGTDHAPHTMEEKLNNKCFGIPGVENSLELMLKGLEKNIDMQRLQEIMCRNPAEIFNIKGKGRIKIGYDADLIVVDVNKKRIITNDNIVSKCGWTPYVGFETGGQVLLTIVRGNIVYDGKNFVKKIGREVRYK